VRRTVTVESGIFGSGSLRGGSWEDAEDLSRSLMQAIRYYLSDQGSDRGGWSYPSFHRNASGGTMIEVQIDIDEASWEAFSKQAAQQEVSTDQLAEHAVLYFAADRDRGRLAERLAKKIESGET
jgi:hypothetical protein